MYAKKACEENSVPHDEVMTFIDVLSSHWTAGLLCAHLMQSGDIFYMLLDLKITLIKFCEGNMAKRLQELKDALESKDFEVTTQYFTFCMVIH